MKFKNKVAIISGAASGMGLALSQRLAEEGAKVVLTDVNLEAAEKAANDICEKEGCAIAMEVDVRDYTMVKKAADDTIKRYGHIDILANFAGGSSQRVFGANKSFSELPIEVVDWGIDVNFKGPIYFAHSIIGQMIKQKEGVIINIGSIDGETGSHSIDYSASKSGVMYGLTKSLAMLGAPYGVRVCCVSPGPVLTREAMKNMKTAIGRAAEPMEIIKLVEYLCSEDAAFITGVNYLIDGGRNICKR